MNRDKAKELLRLHPPGRDPGRDAELRRALELLNRDPVLRRWYEKETEFDRAVARNWKEIPVPAGLREDLLTRRRAPVLTFPGLRPVAAAAAALLLLAAAWAFFLPAEPDNPNPAVARASPDFLGELVSFFHTEPDFDQFGTNFAVLQDRVRAEGGPVADTLPPGIEEMERYRCRVFNRREQKVALICMQRQDETLHLFVVDEGYGDDTGRSAGEPQFTEFQGWAFADWKEGGKTCVLATRGSKDQLKPLF